ncbi:hypothetical protein NBRC116588_32630 [Pyruvatibacter sp. HU-CL02332]|uniref:hypothetical protein n=1 Tax=Pyruvatibacter sp. HU-CL02332 TaxID=3127650 RepID=UPI003101D584
MSFSASRCICAVFGLTFLAGCNGSLIETRQIGYVDKIGEPITAEGFAYFLPRRMAEVRIVRREATPALAPKTALAKLVAAEATQKKSQTDSASARAALAWAKKHSYGAKEIEKRTIAAGDALQALEAARKGVLSAQAAYDKARAVADAKKNNQTVKWEETISLKLLPVEPDPNHRMIANFDSSIFRDNTITLTVKNGLLESGSGTSRDETAPIIVAIASTAAAFVTPTFPMGRTYSQSKGQENALAQPKVKERFDRTLIVDPTNAQEIEDTINSILSEELFDFSVALQREGAPSEHFAVTPPACAVARRDGCGGLLYRQTRRYMWDVVANLNSLAADAGETIRQIAFSAPDTSAVTLLPLDTAPLVTSKHQFKFAAGELVSHSVEKPSTALAAASLPLDVMRAIIKVPTELIQLRVNYATESNNAVDQQVRLLEAQKKLLDAQTAYDDAVEAAEE